MKSKGKKKEELDALKKELADAKNLFVAQFQGMTVAQDTELRQKIRGTKSKYRVVKNTLGKKGRKGRLPSRFPNRSMDRPQLRITPKILFRLQRPLLPMRKPIHCSRLRLEWSKAG